MNINEVNINELEKQRAKAIKDSGEYIELSILIGTNDETYDNKLGKMPVINNSLHGCGPLEIACMFKTLKQMVEVYKKEYPLECALADTIFNTTDLGAYR